MTTAGTVPADQRRDGTGVPSSAIAASEALPVRTAQLLKQAKVLVLRARTAVASSQEAHQRAALLAGHSRRLRVAGSDDTASSVPGDGLAGFTLHGQVAGRRVTASWARGGELHADPLLRRQAETVVALGEEFARSDGGRLPADLTGEGIATLLTLVRGCDKVLDVRLDVPRALPRPTTPG